MSCLSTILIADDDVVVRQLLSHHFEKSGLYAEIFESGELLLKNFTHEVSVCVVDLKMDGMDGMACMKAIKKKSPRTEVIILTTVNQAKEALDAMRHGAFDYLTKPFDPLEVVLSVKKAMQLSKSAKEVVEVKESVGFSGTSDHLLCKSSIMERLKALLGRIGPSENVVLITGESGTGKGVYARSVHAESARASGPFITVSCASLPRELLESEMFGHEKGAFSGAIAKRLGRVELADKGTLFLDELGELPLELQPKLLNFLQDRSFFRVGGQKNLTVDVRIIAATNRDLLKMVKEGAFREDLYFRLNVLPVELPPLWQRPEDILYLANYFLERAVKRQRTRKYKFTKNAEKLLSQYGWPGNVRELENVVERSFTLAMEEGRIRRADLPDEIRNPAIDSSSNSGSSFIGMTLHQVEQQMIELTLKACGGNKAETARKLGITEKSVYNKMKRYQERRTNEKKDTPSR